MFLAPVHTAVLYTSGVGGGGGGGATRMYMHAHIGQWLVWSVVGLSCNSPGVFVAWVPQLKPQMLTQCGVSDKVSICKHFPTPVCTHTHLLYIYANNKHCGEGSQC